MSLDEGMIAPGETCCSIPRTGESGLLIDAADFYSALYDVAPRAECYLAFAGWQFDSDVPLLHGDPKEAEHEHDPPVELLPFLTELLKRNESLEIYMLAWDFNPIYVFEREWFQKWRFTWSRSGSERLHFELDGTHPIGGSHHQKLILVDGTLAYLGGMDVCDHRWDDREHRLENPSRTTTDGRPYHPYHDVQAYVTGDAARALVGLFEERWKLATGHELRLPTVDIEHTTSSTIEMGPARVALSETRGAMADVDAPACDHIAVKYERWIAGAKRLIYIENQYFTAQRIFDALLARIRQEGDPISIVMVLPRLPSAFKEMVALGIRQCKLLTELVRASESSPHRLGIYYSSPGDSPDDATYIHSKVLIVDDTYLSVGSANTTNRSLAIDSELDVAWFGEELEERIRDVRLTLLREHAGTKKLDGSIDHLVEELEALCDEGNNKLYRLPFDDYGPVEGIPDVALDPESPLVVEALEALELRGARELFVRGMARLRGRFEAEASESTSGNG